MSAKKRSAKLAKTPAGDALRALQKKGRAPSSNKIGTSLSQPQNRWQRAVRYTWDKNRGRG